MNWGKGIVLVLVFFVAFMATMVGIVVKHAQVDLVVENYYEQEVRYGEQMEALKQGLKERHKPSISFNQESRRLEVWFSKTLPDQGFNCHLYRASNSKEDLFFRTEGNQLMVSMNEAPVGQWTIKLDWEVEGKAAAFQSEITI